MNAAIAVEIARLAMCIGKTVTTGKAHQDVDVSAILLQIISKATQGYEDHTGQKLDPSLLRAEDVP
jgi:hypothetical protein